VAVQAKGYSAPVGNKAVQEVYAGMAHHRCDTCTVITNNSFTTSAIALAGSTRCLLVHEENFADFVFGRVDLTTITSNETDAGPIG
jgi:restriction system protein